MANLVAKPNWDEVPQLEIDTPAMGGPDGPMNAQAQSLLNRIEATNKKLLEIYVTDPKYNGGAVGDWDGTTGTDNYLAFKAALEDAATIARTTGRGVKVVVPPGRYLISDELDIFRRNSPRADLIIEGADQLSSILVAGFSGVGKSLIKCIDPDRTYRSSPTSIRKLGFAAVGSMRPRPCFVHLEGLGESRLEELRFFSNDTTALRVGSAQNVRCRDIVSYYSGKFFLYKDTTGVTFETTLGGNTVVASSPIFSAADVGRILTIHPANPSNRIKYRIAEIIDGYTAQVEGTTLNATGALGFFDSAKCAMDSGSAVLTADCDCFTPDDVGHVIYVRGARVGAYGPAMLRAQIVSYIAPNQVELDKPATRTITSEYFAVPVVDFYKPDFGSPGLLAGSNDVKIELLHVENHKGVALCWQDSVFAHIMDCKIHGEQDHTATQASTAHAWLDDFSGIISGELDGGELSDSRIYACNFNDLLTVDWLASRMLRGETVINADKTTDPGGYIELRSAVVHAPITDLSEIVKDANAPDDPRVLWNGPIYSQRTQARARNYVGRQCFFTPDGRRVYGPTSAEGQYHDILSDVGGARQMFENIGVRRYSVGNNAGRGFTIRDESAGVNRLQVTELGTVAPGGDGSQNLGAAGFRWAEVFSANGVINTSDEREKTQIRAVTEAERAVAMRLKGLIRAFKFNEAVAKKGDGARIHFGVIAQQVAQAFADEGLNPDEYGLFCYDEWDEQPEERDNKGNIITPFRAAGNRYGIRYNELISFIIAAL